MTTVHREMVEAYAATILGRPLPAWVADYRVGPDVWSWRDIARQLRMATGDRVSVSYETLRTWYGGAS